MIELTVAIIALILAYQAKTRSSALDSRLKRVETLLDTLEREVTDFLRTNRQPPSTAAPEPDTPAPPVAPSEPRTVPAIKTSAPPYEPDDVPPEMAAATGKGDGNGNGSGTTIGGQPPGAMPPRPAAPGLEEKLGTRWAVWAGGAALALGGLLLVRFSIEAGLLGPGVRVALGALLAAALIAGGEYLRRTELTLPIDVLPAANVPSILTAAGTVVAFGTIYAAHGLYDLIGPATAFGLLGATALITMLAAAIHGPWLAGLGIAGAYVTPLLVSSNAPNPWPVVLYLVAVASAAYTLSRTRNWLWLAWSAVAGAALWGLMFITQAAFENVAWFSAAYTHALVQLALAAFFLGIEPSSDTKDADAKPDVISAVALTVLTLIVAAILASGKLDIVSRELVAAAAIAILSATAWRAAPVAVAAVLAGLLAVVLQLAWPNLALSADPNLTPPDAEYMLRLPENVTAFLTFSIIAIAAPAILAALRLWRSPRLQMPTAAIYAAAATVPPLLALMTAYLRVTQFDASIPFALGGAVLALAFTYAAERLHQADVELDVPAYNTGAGVFAAAAIAALAFALFAILERGYLTVVLAITALGTAYIATKRDIPVLRYAVAAIGLIVLARVINDPRIMGDSVGTTPIFNWLLIGYGVPALCFAFAARWLEPLGDSLAARLSDALAVIFTALLAFWEIRHLTNGGNVLSNGTSLAESGLMLFTAIALSYALGRMNSTKPNPVFDIASLIFGAISVGIAAFGTFLLRNPLFTGDTIASAYGFNELMLGYLLPGLAALYAARHARTFRPEIYVRTAGILAMLLIVTYVTLEVRRAFHGSMIAWDRGVTEPEQWAYSAAWLALSVALLAYGLIRGSLEARIASAALIIITALKVTLIDLADIGGLWRALSFLCLGAVLIGIGLVYQKLIFAKPRSEPPPAEPA